MSLTQSHPGSTALLALYDAQLRGMAEFEDPSEVVRIGPLFAAYFALRRRGFISYESLNDANVSELIDVAIAHFAKMPDIDYFEWKTRGHDAPQNLLGTLAHRGFKIGERETVMLGSVEGVIAAESSLPREYTVQPCESAAELREAEHLAGLVFEDSPENSARLGDALVKQWQQDPQSFEMWVVRDGTGAVVCSGRVQFVNGTDFASLWGGACEVTHRGKGLYRALTAARARSARARGKKYLHSDCTEYSRPILEKSGLIPVTTTTPTTYSFTR